MDLPVIYSGPYSFNIAACEKYFSRIKTNLLNPDGLPLGLK